MQHHIRLVIDWIAYLAASTMFLVLAFQDIRLPGPHDDEVYPTASAR